MSTFAAAEAISRIAEPLHWTPEKNALMVEACREMAIFHAENSPETRFLYQRRGFDPRELVREEDLARLPTIGVTAMKHFLLTSLPEEMAVLKLTSSGTRGQKTQIWFDQASLDRVQAMMDVLWGQEGLISSTPTNYACFIYDADQAKDLGISFSVKNEQRFAPAAESFFTVRRGQDGAWAFQRELTVRRLREFAQAGKPVRLLGIPSFIFELLQALEGQPPIALPPNSYMLTGGGWKAAEDKSVTREKFRDLVHERLGIPPSHMRDGFGMAEHSAPYIECTHHRFHIPVYNRILVRDPVTDSVLPPGKTGVLEFITPFNAMMPTLAILSTDLGYLDADPCSCGRRSPTFTLVGRGGITKHKGCAITAGEIVRRD
jgi:phenylacetate-coenzyme A ligase PaaK-like adenylate-forming protein